MIRLLINTREIYKIESYSQYLGKQCFSGIRGAKSSVFCVVFGRSLFVFIILAMVLKPILCNFYSSYDIFFFLHYISWNCSNCFRVVFISLLLSHFSYAPGTAVIVIWWGQNTIEPEL